MDPVNICRCCMAEGYHKDLNSSDSYFDIKGTYSDMLQECFDIVLSKNQMCNLICDVCIKSLHSSLCFKRQVLKVELDFIKWMKGKHENDNIMTVKDEPKADEDDDTESDNYIICETANDTSPSESETKEQPKRRPKLSTKKETKDDIFKTDNNLINEFIDKKYVEVKVEPKPEGDGDDKYLSDSIKQTDKITSSRLEVKRKVRTKKHKGDRSWRTKKIKTLVNRLASSISSSEIGDLEMDEKISLRKGGKRKITISQKESNIDLMWSSRGSTEKAKHRENLQTILEHSNAVPFKNKSLLGYVCGYCDDTFPDPADLRTHTGTKHEMDRLNLKSNFDMSENNVKLDVTGLLCSLCNQVMVDLTALKDHLVKSHDKTIHTDIKDHIQQFKLRKGEVYDCVMCTSTYETFKMLKQHMNKHYNNYTCSKCHSSFATKRSLNAHQTIHQEGNFKCDKCEKVFTSRAKRQYHEKTKHLGERNISNCPYCGQPFRSYYQRNQHLVKVHNTEAQYKCNVCSKSYILKSLLMYHIKKSHLMERNCQCSECGFRFFSKKALKAHMVKHTGKRVFACEVCHKSYARKYTLREHMRIHNNDRRFKCDVCSVSFVQKCSLKSHLLSNHGISLAASDITST